MPVLAIGIGSPKKGSMPPPFKPGQKKSVGGPPKPDAGDAGGPPKLPASDDNAAPPPAGADNGGDALARAHECMEQIFNGDPAVGKALAGLLSAICNEEQQEGEYPPDSASGGAAPTDGSPAGDGGGGY